MKKRFVVLVIAAFMLFVFGSMAEATVANKQIQVNYNNVKIVTNGKAVTLTADQEPFLLNGVTFVPLRAAGQALNSTVNWEASTKTVVITGNSNNNASNTDLLVQIAQKNQEIVALKAQVAALQAKLDDEDTDEDYDLDKIEDKLLDQYGELEDVKIDEIALKGDDDFVKVDVEVDLDDYKKEWKDLTEREIKNWVEDLVEEIQAKLNSNTVVDGMIYSTDDEDLVEFYKRGKNRLDVYIINNYKGVNASKVIDSLEGDRYSVEGIRFSIGELDYEEDKELVNVNFEAEAADVAERWDELNRIEISDAVDKIGKAIAGEFENEDVPVEAVRLYFYDEDNERLGSYRYNNN
ncbi:hypothetical protein SPSYN_00799 [Sporotomaculum syntrophicum]|uniref:Copper amine oxidase-like N-terminal domain-containing protein n=1 Tax=Sporotomaculum syntrophicum TaxID=182264 RepID=A0A9D2WSF0_9FIRM|nr:copper amine oxidase N-terminal domain-containing protein [Sporotomaculum syntrophicum]KAF1086061.1 hypothetical protein SPSYN_00799 [Sporotomaculum syntrophicum]